MSVSIKTENGIIKVGDVGGGGGSTSAAMVSFNPTSTSLESTNVQDAIVEVDGKINGYIPLIDYLSSTIIANNQVLNYTPSRDGWMYVLTDGGSFKNDGIYVNGTIQFTVANTMLFPVKAGDNYQSENVIRIARFY